MFADETKYEIARQAVLKWASAFMDQLDIDSLRMLGSLNDIYQLKKYTGVETPLCGF
jgi:predicted polyphosphate/ATP-dependent NAD kinase